MLKSLQQASKEELRTLVDFARRLIVKEQEVADAAEEIALVRAGANYVASEATPRDWTQVVAYAAPGSSSVETRLSPLWLHRAAGSEAATFAIDGDLSLWQLMGANSWVNVTTGGIRTAADPSWPRVEVPAGETYVDPVNARYLIPTLVWLDRTTGEVSALGPGSGEFVGGTTGGNTYPDGLSDLIPTPQEYVTALLKVSTGMLAGTELIAMQDAIASFEAAGPWEDVRQPYFALNSAGQVVLGDDGYPLRNPLRVTDVAFRGELNDYYRRLVRDFNISPAKSRTAGQFEVIDWRLVTGLSGTEMKRFIAVHTECVRVFKAAFYNEAMESDELYFRYCRTYIAWMAVLRFSNERMKSLTDIDRMTSYELTNLLYSYGVYQFDDMPVIYRRRLAKNLEKMLSEKGTTQVFKDILGLFNLEKDLKIWKHYLVRYFPSRTTILKCPRALVAGEKIQILLESGDMLEATSLDEAAYFIEQVQTFRKAVADADALTVTVWREEDTDGGVVAAYIIEEATSAVTGEFVVSAGDVDYTLPEVGFQKADIDDPVAETTVANMDTAYITDYDEFVSRDRTWETTREDARQLAFSVVQTKYFSISSAVDAAYNGMALSMIWGMLKDAQTRGRTAGMTIEGANTLEGVLSMNLFEAMVAAMTLILWRFDVDDLIPHGEGGVSTIIAARTDGSAFPGEGSLLPFSTVLDRVADQPDPLGAQKVATMTDRNIEISRTVDSVLVDLGRVGANAYDGVKGGEESQTVAKEAKVRALWNHKFVSKLQTDAFGSADRYSDWLDRVNPELATWVRKMDADGDYVNAILSLTLLIEDNIDSLYLNLPMAIGMNDIVMMYIERMVRFFKAYTTDLRNFSTFLLVDRPATECVRLMNLLAGMKVTWTAGDEMDKMEDVYRTLSRWIADESRPGGLLLDLSACITRAKEHDIARILDGMPSWYLYALEVSPAAKMRDKLSISVSFSKREALMMATKGQRPGDVFTMKLEDPSGLDNSLLMTLDSAPVVPASLDEAELTGEAQNAASPLTQAAVGPAEYGTATRPRPRGLQGLGDGAMIIPN
jgi:hypothetical protein